MTKLKTFRLKGLEKIELAPILADGGMGTEFFQIGDTVPDSFSITKAEDTINSEFVEEVDDPIDESVSQKGERTIAWETKNLHPDVFSKLFGGSVDKVKKEWAENDTVSFVELSVKVTAKTGAYIQMPRVRISNAGDLFLKKSAMSTIKVQGKMLKPTKEGEKAFKIVYPNTVTIA